MRKIWRILLESLRGESRDYTEGSISTAVILLGVPMVLEMLMESVFAVTDIFFVSGIGPNAVAAIGLTESLLTVVYTVSFGLSIGASAMVARRIGERDLNGAADTAVQILALGAMLSAVIGLAGVAYAPELLRAMGGSPDVIEASTGYMRVMFGGNAAILLLFLGNAIFRGAGDGAVAMRALWLANGLNLLLVPCFVHGLWFFPKLGVTGAGVATALARGLGAVYALSHLFGAGIGRVKLTRANFVLKPELIVRILRLSGAGTLQVFIGTASWVGLVRVVSTFGAAAVAGYTIGFRVILFALFPAFGLANAAATMVGQSLGAQKPERAEKAVWLAGLYNLVFLGGMGLLYLIFANEIMRWFSNDREVLGYAVACLRTVASGFFFYAFGMVLTNAFNGAGDTWTPTLINFFVFWLIEIPGAYVLAIPLSLGPQGVFYAVTFCFCALAVVSAAVFRRGRWKTKRV